MSRIFVSQCGDFSLPKSAAGDNSRVASGAGPLSLLVPSEPIMCSAVRSPGISCRAVRWNKPRLRAIRHGSNTSSTSRDKPSSSKADHILWLFVESMRCGSWDNSFQECELGTGAARASVSDVILSAASGLGENVPRFGEKVGLSAARFGDRAYSACMDEEVEIPPGAGLLLT
jgi:hypothetical protein